MYAKKKPSPGASSHYVISLDKEDLSKPRDQRGFQYLGKLRAQSGLMNYILYDDGDNPSTHTYDSDTEESASTGLGSVRSELCVIHYSKSKKVENSKNLSTVANTD